MKHSRFIITTILASTLIFSSCSSTPKEVPEDLTVQELIQDAQNAYENGKDKEAIYYYNLIIEKYGNDSNAYVIAKYEIAHIYIKKHKYQLAEPILEEIITIYKNTSAGILPGAYYKLALSDYKKIPENKKTTNLDIE